MIFSLRKKKDANINNEAITKGNNGPEIIARIC